MAFRVGGDEFVVTVEPERATKDTFNDALARSDKAMYIMKKQSKKIKDT
ncbi:hypothetical protein [Moritella dasanensis]|jgi:GGDEF domain-containing protein|nr:hypothetical protein [Moritella dasanensis]